MVSESNKALFEFFASFELVNIAASIATNLLLVYLILHRSSQEIGAYRFLLLAFALNDIYFPIVHFLTLPVICSYKDAFIMFSHGVLRSRVSICLFACSFSQTMPIMSHLFVYRLIATKWPTLLHYYTRRSCCIMVVVTVFVESSLWFLNCYYNYGPDVETEKYVQPFLNSEFPKEGDEFIGALYYSVEGKFRLRGILATMGFNTIMSVCMSVIMFCSYTIVSHIRSATAQWSGKAKTVQLQLFRTLVAQTIIPMIFVYFPCAGIINLPMLGFRLNVFPNLVSASLTLFPLIDAFIITFGVRSYRQTVLLLFVRPAPGMITASVNTSALTQSRAPGVSSAMHVLAISSLLSVAVAFSPHQMERLANMTDILGNKVNATFASISIYEDSVKLGTTLEDYLKICVGSSDKLTQSLEDYQKEITIYQKELTILFSSLMVSSPLSSKEQVLKIMEEQAPRYWAWGKELTFFLQKMDTESANFVKSLWNDMLDLLVEISHQDKPMDNLIEHIPIIGKSTRKILADYASLPQSSKDTLERMTCWHTAYKYLDRKNVLGSALTIIDAFADLRKKEEPERSDL